MSDQFKGLVKVAHAAFLAEQSKLARIRSEEKAIRAQLGQLRADQTRLAERGSDGHDPAMAAGADALWMRWIAGRKQELNAALMQLQSRKARQFDAVKEAFGRHQATIALDARKRREAEALLARRAL